MKEDIYLPRMGQTMTEGTVEKWLKKDGDIIEKGEGVAEISTDKVTATVESPEAGTLHIIVDEGSTVPVGEVIAQVE
jgi:pyruvate/2-oxoglutarate dehydrogenase complex dihydrolipoamide acyltransferase (E2) component